MAVKEKNTVTSSFQEEFVRRFKTKPLLFVGTILVLVLVIVSFVVVPAMVPNAGGSVDLVFGSYNKTPIELVPGNYFAQANADLNEQYRQFLEYIQPVELMHEAFNATVVHIGVLDEMKKAGYTAPAALVDRRIAERPDWLAAYRRSDNVAKLAQWKQVQEGIAEGNYHLDMTGRVSSKEAAFIGAMAARERTFAMASLPLDAYPDTEAASYAAENPQLFRTIRLSRITPGASDKEAEQILGTIRGEVTTFEEAAQTYSRDQYSGQGGDMGSKMAWELFSEIPEEADREKIFALPQGELSGIIAVPEGWAFFRVDEAAAPANTDNAETMRKIRSYIMDVARGRVEDWLIKDAELLAEEIRASGLDDALAARGTEKKNFGPVPVNYGNTELFTSLSSFGINELSWGASSENFWQTAFSTPLQSPSRPMVLGSNVVILYPLEETNDTGPETSAARAESNYSSYVLAGIVNQNIRTYFITSKKLENHFAETYYKYFQPSYY
ncbi:hypothetical protein AGMMS49928_05450 [Spirochaetia bacterium]|nr:hypothetical protein AGMMS49928_05450 [Spirochaetia bacterium]